MDKYLDFFNKCIEGKVGHKKNFHILDSNKSDLIKKSDSMDVSVVSPTQAAVEQARSELKDEKSINRGKKRKCNQVGGRNDKERNKINSKYKKKVVHKSAEIKSKKKNLKRKAENKNNKKGKKVGKNSLKSYKAIWM